MKEKPDWYLAVRIPAGSFEDLLALTYEVGGELREIAPEYKTQIEQMTKALPNGAKTFRNIPDLAIPELADETSKPKRPRASPGEGLSGTCKGFILKHLRRKTRTSIELRQFARDANVAWDVKGLDSRLSEMKSAGWVTLTMQGWELTAAGRVVSKQALGQKRPGKKGGGTQVDVITAFLEKHYPDPVPLRRCCEELDRRGMRGRSASTALHYMKHEGVVAHDTEHATYTFIPIENRQQQGAK